MTAISSTMGSGIPMLETGKMETVGKSSLDRADFMKLFITQLQYQDPMKPMDSYEMASQLAQFSTMEATMAMSDNMEKLLNYQVSQNNLQLLSLIGKNIETHGNEIGIHGGEVARTSYVLEESSAFTMVYIYNDAGQLVRTYDMGYQGAGRRTLAWDGKDNNGKQMPDGLYTYKVDALTASGASVGVERRASGKVTGLEFESGRAAITVSGHAIKYVSDIIQVYDSGTKMVADEPPPADPGGDDPGDGDPGEQHADAGDTSDDHQYDESGELEPEYEA